MWVDKPLAHYQIVDLEDIVYGQIVNEQSYLRGKLKLSNVLW
jgi:hypothetical protein